jgi:hypothetical protein
VRPDAAERARQVLASAGETVTVIGEIVEGERGVEMAD